MALISASELPNWSEGILSYTFSSKSIHEGTAHTNTAVVISDNIDFLFIMNCF